MICCLFVTSGSFHWEWKQRMNGLSFLLLGCCYFLAYCSFVIHLRSNPRAFHHIALRGKSRPPISKSAQVKHVRKTENATWTKTVRLWIQVRFVMHRYHSASNNYSDYLQWLEKINETRSSPIRLSLFFLPPKRSFTVIVTEDGDVRAYCGHFML